MLGNYPSVIEVYEFKQVAYILSLHRTYLQEHISILSHPLRSSVGKPFIKLLSRTCFLDYHLRHTIIVGHCRGCKLLQLHFYVFKANLLNFLVLFTKKFQWILIFVAGFNPAYIVDLLQQVRFKIFSVIIIFQVSLLNVRKRLQKFSFTLSSIPFNALLKDCFFKFLFFTFFPLLHFHKTGHGRLTGLHYFNIF